MNAQKILFPAGIAAACLALGSPIYAQSNASNLDASADVHIGSLGIGAEVGKEITPNLAARVGFNAFNYNYNSKPQNITYDGQLKLSTFTALLDLFPFKKGAFHFTGGYIDNSNKITGSGTPTNGELTLSDGTQISASDVGSLSAKVNWPSSTYYLGLGFGKPSEDGSRLRVLFDVGALFQGSPRVNLTPNYTAALLSEPARVSGPIIASINSEISTEEAKYHSDFNGFKVYPVIQLGLAVHI